MNIFITGTDTNIGKTLVASWLCLHTQYDYYKPIQTGFLEYQTTDSQLVQQLSGCTIHPETYLLKLPVSPHLAAQHENQKINMLKIIDNYNHINSSTLILEGAGGLLVPLQTHKKIFMVTLIKKLNIPVIVVTSLKLGTINHTLLTLEALKKRKIKIQGIISTGEFNQDNYNALNYYAKYYGDIKILAHLPVLKNINSDTLLSIPLPETLKNAFTK